jgi:tungstate transport system ATP-binding protein
MVRAEPPILPLLLEGVTYAVAGRTLVDCISLAIEAGPRTVILGPNGAGKSLLLRLCHGLIPPSAGRIVWHGAGAAVEGSLRQRQAMVFQRPVLLRRSASANVDYALGLRGLARAVRRERVAEALDRVGLAALAGRPARILSGGEQQRLALARAWALRPEILFLDEPTASLDPAATRAVEQIIDAFHAAGTKIVMTTHDLGQARRLADEIVFLHQGRIAEHGEAAAFFDRPASPEARAFLTGDLLW